MTKKMLIDASHAEETRVVVLDGNRLEDFDVETANRKQIKGNIYLAKVIRVEPSLQAAFVEYGGNRHGFLAFGEIHPDYYQIPVADRKRLLAMQAEDEREEARAAEAHEAQSEAPAQDGASAGTAEEASEAPAAQALSVTPIEIISAPPPEEAGEAVSALAGDLAAVEEAGEGAENTAEGEAEPANGHDADESPAAPPPENLGGDGDDAAEARERRQRQRFLRNYKIQDVIHRRQIMLIQVVKEERGNKGAALTTYLSLAGRFSVLMPNSPSGGGVSRKITSVADRRRLKEAMAELDVPDGMGLIVRTAGANRPKPEIKRDCEYLLRLWDDIRERTMESVAPALIYEEASLIKRTIRDVYTRDVEEVLVDGEEGFKAARDFMRMLMPSHAKKVQLWTEGQPLFARYQVEAQLDAMLNPIVQLRSGGYIVINQTEALVAIDVNSGRSTRERSIEDTALRTNLEAAEEVAKQLRMRDLAGLIVIDFIDMESRKNNTAVERKLKDSLKNDRARIQIGSISHFGLMEMSRQRLRPSLTEASLITCPHCAGMGYIRSPESAALHILRAIEDEGGKFRAAEIAVVLPPEIAFYLFNHKRERLSAIEARYAMRVVFTPDSTMTGTSFRIEKIRAQTITAPVVAPASYTGPITPERSLERAAPVQEEAETEAAVEEADSDAPNASDTAEEGERKRRRRRRRGKRRGENGAEVPAAGTEGEAEGESAPEPEAAPAVADDQPTEIDLVMAAELGEPAGETEMLAVVEEPAPRRRRTRGGTRRRRTGEDEAPSADVAPAEPVFADVADIFEAAERAEEQRLRLRDLAQVVSEPAIAPPVPVVQQPASQEATVEATVEAAPAAPVLAQTSASVDETRREPLVKPLVISGEDMPAVEKKRGWWRR
ncbi:ribonuclease E/G [Acidocella sp.]|uniref:Rne/Rng family ribonuclease n=1 Tax=Acidocella sp. TaxID=50710 RepID=UPI002602E501|nr:ribonuclease E/G [Acidocella sp.]MDD2795205.1 Rne/Rng family ribonuclease [Acidocella sp.]